MVHKRRYIVIGYGGSKLFPFKEIKMAGSVKEKEAAIREFKSLPEIKNIHVMKDGLVKTIEEEFALQKSPKVYKALWHDKPNVKEVVYEK